MQHIILHRRPGLSHKRVWLAFGLEIDGSAVERATDRAGEKRTIVAGIVPSKSTLIVGILPEPRQELDRIDRGFAVEHHRLAVCFYLFTAPRPEIGVAEGRGVAEGVAKSLADRMPVRLKLPASGPILLPSCRELASGIADLLEPRFSISEH